MSHFKESNFSDLQDSLEAKWINRQHTTKKSQIFPTEISSKQAKDSQLSNTRHKIRRGSRNIIDNTEIDNKMNKIIKDFGVLRRCIKVYCREESKNKNKQSFDQVLKMIEAFNRSQVNSVSKQVSILVQKMIRTIKFAENVNQDSSISLESSRISNQQSFQYERPQQEYTIVEVKDKLMGQIQLLDQTLMELRQENKKISQAKNLAVRMTKYERWSEIGRLQQIIIDQQKKIEQINAKNILD